MSQAVVRALSGVTLGAAAWFSLGTLAVAERSVVVGLLPPLWLLAVLAIVGATFTVRMRRIPLSTALLPAVAIVPWIGSARIPATLLWSGPFVAIVWALFCVAVARAWGQAPRQILRRHVAISATGPAPVVAVVAATVAAFALGALRTGITGDEPHYLLVSQSMLLDGDLDLANDYDVARHRFIYPAPLEPRHTVLAPSGHEYSFHGIGVAALALPGFAIGGLHGAQALFALLATVGVLGFWIVAREIAGDTVAAWVATAALVLHLPFLGQAAAIYPDGPAAAITSFALLTLVREERAARVSIAWLIACAAALSVLPWLHMRLTLIAVVFATALIVTMRRRGRSSGDVAAFLALPVIAAVLFFASTYVMFETFDPTAVFRGKASGSIAAIPTGITGLLVDHEYGLLMYAPVFALSFVGWHHLRRAAPLTAAAAAVAAVGTLLVSAAFVWWGGTTSPARFLVPVLPACAIGIAAWWSRATLRARHVTIGLIAYAATVAALAGWADQGRYVTTDADGQLTIFEWANRAVDIPRALPSLFRPGTTPGSELTIALIWIAIGAGMLRLLRRIPVGWGVVVWLTFAAGAAWMMRGGHPVTPDRSQLALLRASPYLSTPWRDRRPISSIDAVMQTLTFEGEVTRAPAGRYRVEPESNATNVSVAIGSEHEVLRWPTSATEDERTFSLPVAVASIHVSGGRLRPLSPQRGVGAPPAQYAVRSGEALLFVWDSPQRDPDGFWVAADRPVRVLCTQRTGEAPCAALQFRLAAHDASVRLTTSDDVMKILIRKASDVGVVELPQTMAPVLIDASGPPSRTRAVFVTALPQPAVR